MAAFIPLPVLVYSGLRGHEGPAIPLAAATTLLFLGIDWFDDVAAGDRPAEANLVLCALAQLAIAGLDAPPSILADGLDRPNLRPRALAWWFDSAGGLAAGVRGFRVHKVELAVRPGVGAGCGGGDAERAQHRERVARNPALELTEPRPFAVRRAS